MDRKIIAQDDDGDMLFHGERGHTPDRPRQTARGERIDEFRFDAVPPSIHTGRKSVRNRISTLFDRKPDTDVDVPGQNVADAVAASTPKAPPSAEEDEVFITMDNVQQQLDATRADLMAQLEAGTFKHNGNVYSVIEHGTKSGETEKFFSPKKVWIEGVKDGPWEVLARVESPAVNLDKPILLAWRVDDEGEVQVVFVTNTRLIKPVLSTNVGVFPVMKRQ